MRFLLKFQSKHYVHTTMLILTVKNCQIDVETHLRTCRTKLELSNLTIHFTILGNVILQDLAPKKHLSHFSISEVLLRQ